MKRRQLTAVLCMLAMGVSLTGCDALKPMDGDGMVNWDDTDEDPIKDNTDNPSQGTDNPVTSNDPAGNDNNGGTEETVSNEDLFEAFFKDEAKVKFDNIIADENTSYTYSEMMDAINESVIDEYWIEEEDGRTVTFTSSYAYIDCGNDGITDLAIRVDADIKGDDNWLETKHEYFVIMNLEDGLVCCASVNGAYRSWANVNKYGYLTTGGSGGANLYVYEGGFVDAKGNYIFDYYYEEHMGYSEPMVPIYSLPSDKRKDDIYKEDFDPEGYTVDVYNFEKYPEYPNDVWTENGIDQAKQDAYDKKYDEWQSKHIFCFYDSEGNDAEPSGDVKKYLDKNGVKYYSPEEAENMLAEHQKELGISKEVETADEPEWQIIG